MISKQKHKYTSLIKQEAIRLGFDYCGISKTMFLKEEAIRLEKWLKEGMHGEMKYMENYFDKRLNPRLLVEGSISIISLLHNYFPQTSTMPHPLSPKIAKYAYGKDYHIVIKEKLNQLMAFINKHIGNVNGKVFVDSAPVMDKVWAVKSGIGWMGKNSNLINKQKGSFFFIGEVIIDLELEYDNPIQNYCGRCTKCIDACPTKAIIQPYVVDGSKCISYFTIELKNEIPVEVKGEFQNWLFGCDICQDVCPWNRFAVPHSESLFNPIANIHELKKKDWIDMQEETFNTVFKNSPIKRAKYSGIKRNLKILDYSK